MKSFSRKTLSTLLLWVLVISVCFSAMSGSGPIRTRAEDSFEESLLSFPESYRDDLRAIHQEYPNWKFVAIDTGLTWEKVVTGESQLGYSLVAGSSLSSWKSTQYGAYDWNTGAWRVLDSGGWVQASRDIIAYYLDPRCYLDSTYLFAFLDYAYDPSSQTLEGLERMVSGTFLEGYFYENGTSYYYPEVLMQVATETQMNPYVMATMIINEQGAGGYGASIADGNYYFNYFNIGAYATSSMNAVERGLWYASLEGSYSRPWNSRYKAIKGGAEFYIENYVEAGQNTLYYKKFNVNPTGSYPTFSHQYMTNIQGCAQEAYSLSLAYSESAKTEALVFEIPVFRNMPDSLGYKPTGSGSPDNRLRSLTVEGYSLTPVFDNETYNYTLVVPEGVSSVTIAAERMSTAATLSGTGSFNLNPGVVNIFRVNVTAENEQVRTFTISISTPGTPVDPGSGTGDNSGGSGDNSSSTGSTQPDKTPTGGDLPAGITTNLFVSGTYIHGIPTVGSGVEEVLSQLSLSSGSARLLTTSGETAGGKAATGQVLQILNGDGSSIASYTLVVYGDANGDGQVTSVDLLRIQKAILGQNPLEGAFLEAADANHDGRVTSVDLLKIQKAILGQTELDQ